MLACCADLLLSCRQRASKDHLHPVVFLHGVGGGLLPYIPFLLRVTSLERPVLAVEYKHLSMRWTDHIPTAPQVGMAMLACVVCWQQDWRRALLFQAVNVACDRGSSCQGTTWCVLHI